MVDAIAHKENVFTKTDARIKVVLTVILISAVIGLSGLQVPLAVAALALSALLLVRTPAGLLLGRIMPPLAFGLIVVGLSVFYHGGHEMFALHIAGYTLVGYQEGLYFGLTILARIAASISVLLFLSVTTPVYELGNALRWLKVPAVIVEILLLTYRYIFVLWDEGTRIREAQTMRLGYPAWRNMAGWKRAVKSTSTLMGMVFIRAYDRAERTFSAMQVRAFDGSIGGPK